MNWLPIAGAKKDGTEYDLWLHSSLDQGQEKGPGIRIPNCRFMHGAWHSIQEIEDGCAWTLIEGYAPTHYCEITPPQEPLDWPDNGGWWWCKYDGVVSMHQVMLMPGNPKIGRRIMLSRIVNNEEDLIRWKFIRAIPPSFGDAP